MVKDGKWKVEQRRIVEARRLCARTIARVCVRADGERETGA